MCFHMSTVICCFTPKLTWCAVYLWARCVINMFSAAVLMGTAFLLVGGNWSASQAGFILTFAMMVSNGIYSMLEQASTLEETFVSAERLNQCMPNHFGHSVHDPIKELM